MSTQHSQIRPVDPGLARVTDTRPWILARAYARIRTPARGSQPRAQRSTVERNRDEQKALDRALTDWRNTLRARHERLRRLHESSELHGRHNAIKRAPEPLLVGGEHPGGIWPHLRLEKPALVGGEHPGGSMMGGEHPGGCSGCEALRAMLRAQGAAYDAELRSVLQKRGA